MGENTEVGDGGRADAVFASPHLDKESSAPGCSDEGSFVVGDEYNLVRTRRAKRVLKGEKLDAEDWTHGRVRA